MHPDFYIEVGIQQKSHAGERICGDVFVSRKIKEEGRTLLVLSDGLGHGVKANLLASLTATMAVNFTREHKDTHKIAEIIMNTLPVCSERKISYSTFTILDMEADGQTTIINYDNPDCMVLRGHEVIQPEWQCIIPDGKNKRKLEIKTCRLQLQKEDRILLLTDGITQSGLGRASHPLGFGWQNTLSLALQTIKDHPALPADRLANTLVNKAHANDAYQAKDDISMAVVYLRQPRKLLLCTGPPYEKAKDPELAAMVNKFPGSKILCGGTTAEIVSRELDLPIADNLVMEDPDLPPLFHMEGIDLVTEGILTLSKVAGILAEWKDSSHLGKGPADRMVRFFLASDEIHFLVGTSVNVAHQDPNLPVELEIRRSVVKKIAHMLEEKLLKEVKLQFI